MEKNTNNNESTQIKMTKKRRPQRRAQTETAERPQTQTKPQNPRRNQARRRTQIQELPVVEAVKDIATETQKPKEQKRRSSRRRNAMPRNKHRIEHSFADISEIGQGGYAKPAWYSPKK